MISCLIIEDQPPAQRILQKFIADIGSLELLGTFSDPVKAMTFLASTPVDLLFLDINLPKISGIDLLRSLPKAPHVILTTAFSEYALEGYELNVVDYLLKPFSFQRFIQAVSKVPHSGDGTDQQNASQALRKELFIKSGYDYVKVIIAEILYIRSDSDYTEIWTSNKKLLSSEPLRYWIDQLSEHQFTRVHKSYIVNPKEISRVSGNQIYLSNGTEIPIGRAYKENFMQGFIDPAL